MSLIRVILKILRKKLLKQSEFKKHCLLFSAILGLTTGYRHVAGSSSGAIANPSYRGVRGTLNLSWFNTLPLVWWGVIIRSRHLTMGQNDEGSCSSPVVKVSDHGRHVVSSSPVPLKTRRVRERCKLNLSRDQNVLPLVWCDVVVWRGRDASSGVVLSLDHG
ncbi:hypothetical protein TNCV_2558211 [Trichonephila clavipes]|nr:hypothetical protein TNCV_2558211 [Trichonephila clavipes]